MWGPNVIGMLLHLGCDLGMPICDGFSSLFFLILTVVSNNIGAFVIKQIFGAAFHELFSFFPRTARFVAKGFVENRTRNHTSNKRHGTETVHGVLTHVLCSYL